jgi:AcrR family transcriptional regulator
MAAAKQGERRIAVLAAAQNLFFTKGFGGTTTLEIAKAAGVSKRDLYAAFPTKESMLAGLISARVEAMASRVTFGQAESQPQVLKTLEGFAFGFLRFLVGEQAIGLYRLAISGVDHQPDVGRTLLDAGIEGTTARVTAFVAAACQAGFLKIVPEDVDEAVKCFLNVAIGQLQMRCLLDPTATVDEGEIAVRVLSAMRVFRSFET